MREVLVLVGAAVLLAGCYTGGSGYYSEPRRSVWSQYREDYDRRQEQWQRQQQLDTLRSIDRSLRSY